MKCSDSFARFNGLVRSNHGKCLQVCLQLAVCTFLDATGDRVSTFHGSCTQEAAAHWDSKKVLLKVYQSDGGCMDPAWAEGIVVRRLDN